MKNSIFLLVLFVLFSSPSFAGPSEIFKLVGQIEKDLDDPQAFHRQNAVEYMNSISDLTYNLDSKSIFPQNDEERKEFDQNKAAWIRRIFLLQLKLRDIMLSFHAETNLTAVEQASFRRANLYLNYAQDFIFQEWLKYDKIQDPKRLFGGSEPNTLKNPEHNSFQLQAGDVVLVRGSSFVSATIARSGDFVTNYSHVAIIIKSPTGQLIAAEALLETGLTMYPVEDYLKMEMLSRAVVLRPKDQVLAQKAAEAGYKIIHDADGKLLFDLSMNPNDHDKVYCAEFVKMAYKKASEGKLSLPEFQMTYKKILSENVSYKAMGYYLEKGFAPDDIYFQPEFDVVMVHRDQTLFKKAWAWDIAISSIFDYAANRFAYKTDLKTAVLSRFVWGIKKLGFKMSRVPAGVGPNVIETILLHQKVAEALHGHLMIHLESSPNILSYGEMLKIAKRYLQQNQNKYFVSAKTYNSCVYLCSQW